MTGEQEDPALIWEEALDWLFRVQGAPDDRSVRRDLAEWVARSPDHASAWAKAERTWRLMGEVPVMHGDRWIDAPRATAPIMPPSSSAAARPGPSRRRFLAMAGGAVAAGVIGLAAPGLMLDLQADHRTAVGEVRRVTLADGSVVTLDTDSAIAVDFTDRGRLARLLAGRAFFDVRHDGRPFVVRADDAMIGVVGTAFDVRRGNGGIDVAVERGAVRVSAAPDGVAAELLGPGDNARIVGERVARGRIARGSVAAWRRGELVVDGATVAEVVDEIARYRPGVVMVRGEALSRQRVTGVFRTGDTLAAIEAVVRPHGGTITRLSNFCIIVSKG